MRGGRVGPQRGQPHVVLGAPKDRRRGGASGRRGAPRPRPHRGPPHCAAWTGVAAIERRRVRSAARCGRAGPRQTENRIAGVPIGGGGDSPLSCALHRRRPLILTGARIIPADAAPVRCAPEMRFSGRRPRRRGADAPTVCRGPRLPGPHPLRRCGRGRRAAAGGWGPSAASPRRPRRPKRSSTRRRLRATWGAPAAPPPVSAA